MFGDNTELVGLDIGSSTLKVVGLARVRNSLQLKYLACAATPSDLIRDGEIVHIDPLAQVIKNLFKAQGIRQRNVALAISVPGLCVKRIRMPRLATSQEMREMLKWQAFQYVPFDVNQAYLDYQLLESADTESEANILLVAARKKLVDSLVQVAQEAGLRPILVDVGVLALENQYDLNYPGDQKTVVLIDIGANTIHLNILKRGSTIFASSHAGGGSWFTAAIQEKFGLTFSQAETVKRGKGISNLNLNQLKKVILDTSKEVSALIARNMQAFNNIYPQERISKVILSGGGAMFRGFDRFLGTELKVPIEIANPFKGVSIGDRLNKSDITNLAPLSAIGLGLALRRLGNS